MHSVKLSSFFGSVSLVNKYLVNSKIGFSFPFQYLSRISSAFFIFRIEMSVSALPDKMVDQAFCSSAGCHTLKTIASAVLNCSRQQAHTIFSLGGTALSFSGTTVSSIQRKSFMRITSALLHQTCPKTSFSTMTVLKKGKMALNISNHPLEHQNGH